MLSNKSYRLFLEFLTNYVCERYPKLEILTYDNSLQALPQINENWTIYCVRGPLSASELGVPADRAVTDPAALIEDAQALTQLQHAVQELDGLGDVLRVGVRQAEIGVRPVEERAPPGRLAARVVAHGWWVRASV